MSFLSNIFADTSVSGILLTCLDILLVYFVIYRILLTIKGTRAAQMAIGIFFIGASFFIAERLDLATVSWLLDSLINNFVIIAIVIFQQDIRRGLMRLGQNVTQFGKTHQLAHALDEVLTAAEHLARARMGGIVVFEREAELKQFADTGNPIDARVSTELLVALFVPSRDNELHDGAVIIDKNLRIAHAGAVLPLSRSPRLSAKLGTRHRAALGITEETDAVAVVISEERGEISLCVRGVIARDLERDDLRKALQKLFDEEQTADVAEQVRAAAGISLAMAALASEGERSSSKTTTSPPVSSSGPSSGGASGGSSSASSGAVPRMVTPPGRSGAHAMEDPGR